MDRLVREFEVIGQKSAFTRRKAYLISFDFERDCIEFKEPNESTAKRIEPLQRSMSGLDHHRKTNLEVERRYSLESDSQDSMKDASVPAVKGANANPSTSKKNRNRVFRFQDVVKIVKIDDTSLRMVIGREPAVKKKYLWFPTKYDRGMKVLIFGSLNPIDLLCPFLQRNFVIYFMRQSAVERRYVNTSKCRMLQTASFVFFGSACSSRYLNRLLKLINHLKSLIQARLMRTSCI
jgi:hypothetical protein